MSESDAMMPAVEDEVPIQRLTPAPPPPTPKVPPIPKQNSREPMEYTTNITQRVGPASNGHSNGSISEFDLSHIPKKDKDTVKLINRIAIEDLKDYTFTITRLPKDDKPWLEIEAPPYGQWGTYDDICTILREGYGPGTYKVRIFRNGMFLPANQLIIPISIGVERPEQVERVDQPRRVAEVDEATALRREREVLEQQMLTRKKRIEMEELEEKANAKKSKPHDDTIAMLRDELKALREEMKAQPKGMDLKELAAIFAPVITAMIQKPAPVPPDSTGALKEVVNLMMESNKQVMNVALEAAKKKDDHSEFKDLAMMMLEKNINKPDDQLKTMLDMMDRGEERAMKMLEMTHGSDHIEIDPDRPVGSVIAQALARGVEGLIDLFKTGGPEVMKVLAEKVGKPAEAVTPSDMAALEQRLKSANAKQVQQRQLPQAQNPIKPVATTPQLNTAATSFTPTNKDSLSVDLKSIPIISPIQSPPTDSASASTNSPTESPSTEQFVAPSALASEKQTPRENDSLENTTTPMALTDLPVSPVVDDAMERDLREVVEICVRDYMLVDLKAERAEHDWTEFAIAKWGNKFLKQLSDTVEPDTRQHIKKIELVESKTTPALWKQVEAELPKGRNWEYLQWGFSALMRDFNNPPEVLQPDVPIVQQVV